MKKLTHFSAGLFKFDPNFSYKKPHEHNWIANEGIKPNGLWLSDESDYGWQAWTKDNDFMHERWVHKTEFEVDLSNLCILEDYDDIELFTKAYIPNGKISINKFYLNWPKVYEDYSGLLITPYVWSARLDFMWYYGWDCASACIWDLSVLKVLTDNDDLAEGKNNETHERTHRGN